MTLQCSPRPRAAKWSAPHESRSVAIGSRSPATPRLEVSGQGRSACGPGEHRSPPSARPNPYEAPACQRVKRSRREASASRTVVPTATSRAARAWLDFRRRVLQAVPAPNTYRGSGVEPELDVVRRIGSRSHLRTRFVLNPCANATADTETPGTSTPIRAPHRAGVGQPLTKASPDVRSVTGGAALGSQSRGTHTP